MYRTSAGFKSFVGLGIVGLAATTLGAVNTTVIRFTAANITQQTTDGANGYTIAEDANAGTGVTILRPGVYYANLNIALAIAGLLQGGISLGNTAAAFVAPPVDFAVATTGYLAIGGNVTLATTQPLISLNTVFQISRAQIDAVQNVLRFTATLGVTLDGDNSRFAVQRIGNLPDAA